MILSFLKGALMIHALLIILLFLIVILIFLVYWLHSRLARIEEKLGIITPELPGRGYGADPV